MEASGKKIGLVHQAFFINDQAAKIILLLPALLLLIIFLALLNYSEPTASLDVPLTSLRDVWRTALSADSASRAFLLLNCVIVTIIASSKLEISSSTSCKGAAKEEGAEEALEVMMIRGMKGDNYIHAERGGGRALLGSGEKPQTCRHDRYNSSTCSNEGNDDHVYNDQEEEDRSKCCCASSCRKLQAASCHKNDCMTIMEQKSITSMNERPPAAAASSMRSGRLVCTRLGGNMSDTVAPAHKLSHNYSKPDVAVVIRPRDDHLKATSKGRIVLPRKSFSFNDLAMATGHFSAGASQRPPAAGCASIVDCPLNHHMHPYRDPAQAPAAAAPPAPSLEEVWAAIISNKTGDDEYQTYMPSMQSSDQRAIETKYRKNDEMAATSAAVAPTAPAVATVADAAAPAPPATALEGTEANDPDNEVEELNRRAEEFIARFNQQMRLQRQESLQRKRARRRCCVDQEHRYMQRTAPHGGLLVGL